jgi:hypothetical protein
MDGFPSPFGGQPFSQVPVNIPQYVHPAAPGTDEQGKSLYLRYLLLAEGRLFVGQFPFPEISGE